MSNSFLTDRERNHVMVSRNGEAGDEFYLITPAQSTHRDHERLRDVMDDFRDKVNEIWGSAVIRGPVKQEGVTDHPADQSVSSLEDGAERFPDDPSILIDLSEPAPGQNQYIENIRNDSSIGMDFSSLVESSINPSRHDNPEKIRRESGPSDDQIEETVQEIKKMLTSGNLETDQVDSLLENALSGIRESTRQDAHSFHLDALETVEQSVVQKVTEEFGQYRNLADFYPERLSFGSQWIKQPDRYHSGVESYSVSMADIDNFKRLNDVMGYKAGDRYIQAYSLVMATVGLNRFFDRFNGMTMEDFASLFDCHPNDLTINRVLDSAGFKSGDFLQADYGDDADQFIREADEYDMSIYSKTDAGGNVTTTFSPVAHNQSLSRALDESESELKDMKQGQSTFRDEMSRDEMRQ